MKKYVLLLFALIISLAATAQNRYNPYSGKAVLNGVVGLSVRTISIPSGTAEQQKLDRQLRIGYDYQFGLTYYVLNGNGFGLLYNHGWYTGEQDGILIQTPYGKDPALFGVHQTIRFYGLYYSKYMALGKKDGLLLNAGFGINTSQIDSVARASNQFESNQTLVGKTIGGMLAFGYDHRFNEHYSLGCIVNSVTGSLKELTVTDNVSKTITQASLNNGISIGRLEIGLMGRVTF